MNYLLHCWLGRENDGLLAGGFLGDFVKGEIPSNYEPDLQRGIRLHRHIDSESNRLEPMKKTYFRFGTSLRRPAPILLDLVADHIFAKYWHEFAIGDLADFSAKCYQTIGRYYLLPNAAGMHRYMQRTDLFRRYADQDVIYNICRRILVRLRMGQHAGQLATILVSEHDNFKKDFEGYFPLLEAKAQVWLQQKQN